MWHDNETTVDYVNFRLVAKACAELIRDTGGRANFHRHIWRLGYGQILSRSHGCIRTITWPGGRQENRWKERHKV